MKRKDRTMKYKCKNKSCGKECQFDVKRWMTSFCKKGRFERITPHRVRKSRGAK